LWTHEKPHEHGLEVYAAVTPVLSILVRVLERIP
jgi:hypothetical protein